MKRLLLVLALIAVGSGVLCLGSAAAAVRTVKSTVTIASGEGSEFRGKVSSPKKECRDDRRVTLFMKPYDGSADLAVGRDETNASGIWTIEGSFVAGIYYAKVATALEHEGDSTVRCTFDLTMAARF
jgi:hypothetical protein